MPDASLGQLLAQRLNFTKNEWLAPYFAARYRYETAANASLMNHAYLELLFAATKYDDVESLLEIARVHEISPQQFRKLVRGLSTSSTRELLRFQQPPTLEDLHYTLERQSMHRNVLAQLVLRNATWSRVAELPPLYIEELLEEVDLDTRLLWLAQKETLQKRDFDALRRWYRNPYTKGRGPTEDRDHAMGAFIEKHHRSIDALLALESREINSALAASRHLRDVEQQRKVIHLDKMLSTDYQTFLWLKDLLTPYKNEDNSALISLIKNPRTHHRVLEEVQRHVGTADDPHSLFLEGLGVSEIKAALRERRVGTPHYVHVSEDYETVRDPTQLTFLVSAVLKTAVHHMNQSDVVAILANPHVKGTLRNHSGVVHMRTTPEWLTPEPVAQTRALIAAARKRTWGMERCTVAEYRTMLTQTQAVPDLHTKYFVDKLGENHVAWDTVLALSENWTGLVTELVATAQNLQ